MATVSGTLTSAGNGSNFTPAAGRFLVAASGAFDGVAVLMVSLDSGVTFNPAPVQGSANNGPSNAPKAKTALFVGGPGTGTLEMTDTTAGVIYTVAAVASPGRTFSGSLAYSIADVSTVVVTVAPGRTLNMNGNGTPLSAGQTATIDRTEAAALYVKGFILPFA
jgi:hypothetical protein